MTASTPLPRAPRDRAPRRRLRGIAAAATVVAVALGAVVASETAPAVAAATSDSFSRQSTGGWGTAETGGAYTSYGPAGAAFSVDGGRARIAGIPAGTSAGAWSAGTAMLDGTAGATVALVGTTPLGLYQAVEIRRQADGSSYRGKVELGRSGALRVSLSRTASSGASTALGSVVAAGTAEAGTDVNVRVRATGTAPVALAAKAWVAGTDEPDWQATATDASSARIAKAGATGVWSYASGSNSRTTTVAFDDLSRVPAGSTATPAPSPTPTPTASAAPSPAPTPTPSTPVAVPATGARGSAAVGSAAYPVPSGALFVSSGSGDDGAAGTQGAPLRTIVAAVGKARSGQTIVLRGGTYHEAVVVPYAKQLTIQAYPREAVWLDGSRTFSGFAKSGSSWVVSGYTPKHPTTIAGIRDNPRFVRPEAPLAARLDQVFVGGTQLRQVASASQVVPGTFHVDTAAKTLRIGTDPTGKEVRASDLRQALQVQSAGTTLRGFGVRRYATAYEDRGTIRFDNVRATVRDLVVQDNAMTGITIGNDGALLSRVTVQRSGMLGISAAYAYGMVVEDSVITGNNSERFKAAPVSGGIKIGRSRDVTVRDSDTSRNNGSGIWFDESCYDITVTGNTSNDNEYTGIQLELSDTAVIAGNSTTGGQTGINVFDTGNVRIFNNTLGGNSKFGMTLLQDERRQSVASFEGQDPRRPAIDPTVPWLTRNIQISNNVFATGGSFLIYALDKKTGIAVDRWNLTITGNLFAKRVATTDPAMVAWGQGDNRTLVRYETPAALAAAKGSGWRNTQTTGATTVSGMSAYLGQAASLAVALPSAIASLLGQATGVKRVGIF
ncbi:right-handed parallel beta-helix repeat-containing protein [Clavibacter sp. CFBP 8614]|uniref:right-handed parallel beta-helix repeat-containing protein n=1 Tax=unclassified Clavibacter TaxID=2626594 RepID=UPI004041B8F3